jgi:hypothetical protein
VPDFQPPTPELRALADQLIAAEHTEIPRVVQDAFLPAELKVAGFILPAPTFASLLFLHAADSPFVNGRAVTADGILRDVATAVYCLSADWKTVRAETESGTIGERIWETLAALPAFSADELQAVVASIARHVNKGFAPALEMERAGEKSDTQKKMEASAGGSSASAGSASATS